jgi:hypothetical protein
MMRFLLVFFVVRKRSDEFSRALPADGSRTFIF